MPRQILMSSLLLLTACRFKQYKGKDACELLTNQDIAAFMGEPFKPGYRTGLINDSEEYIGSECNFESVARSASFPKEPRFRINVEVSYLEPENASLAAARKNWEKLNSHEKTPYYGNIHEASDIADGALISKLSNGETEVWALLKPNTKVNVTVMNVLVSEVAEAAGRSITLRMVALLKEERASQPKQ